MPRLRRGLGQARHGEHIFGTGVVRLAGSGGFGQKLLKVFEKIGRRVEKTGNLGIYVLNRLLLALIGLQYLEELFVNLGFVLKSIL